MEWYNQSVDWLAKTFFVSQDTKDTQAAEAVNLQNIINRQYGSGLRTTEDFLGLSAEISATDPAKVYKPVTPTYVWVIGGFAILGLLLWSGGGAWLAKKSKGYLKR